MPVRVTTTVEVSVVDSLAVSSPVLDSAMEKINNAWKSASEEMYKASQEAGANTNQQEEQKEVTSNDDVTDVEFEEVKEDK